MMWYGHENVGWGGGAFMLLSMLVFWGLLAWGIWTVLQLNKSRTVAGNDRSPDQVLAHRFASGEIDAESYSRALDVLGSRAGLADRTPRG